MEKKIAVIGAGNLGLSLAKGLVESKTYKPNQFNLSRRRIEKLKNACMSLILSLTGKKKYLSKILGV